MDDQPKESDEEFTHALPDFLAPGLKAIFVGTVSGRKSAERRHYYAHPTNTFWRRLHESGLTPHRLKPDDDGSVLDFGLGLIDLNKTDASGNDAGIRFNVPDFRDRLASTPPVWIVFNGLNPAKAYCRAQGIGTPRCGAQHWTIGPSRVFVVPTPLDRIAMGAKCRGDA